MRESGAVADWDDERGFGFVAPDDGGRRLFVHVSAFPRGQRPRLGDRLTFTRGEDERGRPRALEVHLDRPRTPTRGLRPALAGAVAFLALLALLSALGRCSGTRRPSSRSAPSSGPRSPSAVPPSWPSPRSTSAPDLHGSSPPRPPDG